MSRSHLITLTQARCGEMTEKASAASATKSPQFSSRLHQACDFLQHRTPTKSCRHCELNSPILENLQLLHPKFVFLCLQNVVAICFKLLWLSIASVLVNLPNLLWKNVAAPEKLPIPCPFMIVSKKQVLPPAPILLNNSAHPSIQ